MARNQTAAEEESEAALELTLLSFDADVHNLKRPKPAKTPVAAAKSTRYYAVAWIDPTTKQSTGPITPTTTASRSNNNSSKGRGKTKRKLYFPISPTAIGTPESPSIITIQILSHCRLPFHGGRLVFGTAVIPLASVKLSAETFVLPLKRGSGEVRGSVSVSARILWDLGFRGSGGTTESSVVEDGGCTGMNEVVGGGNNCDCETVGSSESVCGGNAVVPSAPSEPLNLPSTLAVPEPVSVWEGDGFAPTAPPMDDHLESTLAVAKPEAMPDDGEEGGSFLIGLVLGAIAAAVVGVFCSNWRTKLDSTKTLISSVIFSCVLEKWELLF